MRIERAEHVGSRALAAGLDIHPNEKEDELVIDLVWTLEGAASGTARETLRIAL